MFTRIALYTGFLCSLNFSVWAQEAQRDYGSSVLDGLATELREILVDRRAVLESLTGRPSNGSYQKNRQIWGETFTSPENSMGPLEDVIRILEELKQEYMRFRAENSENEELLKEVELRVGAIIRSYTPVISQIIWQFPMSGGFAPFYAEYLEADLFNFISKLSGFPGNESFLLAAQLGLALEELGDIFHPRNKTNLNPSFHRFSLVVSIYELTPPEVAAHALAKLLANHAGQPPESREEAYFKMLREVTVHARIQNMKVAFALRDLALLSHGNESITVKSAGTLISMLASDSTMSLILRSLEIEIQHGELLEQRESEDEYAAAARMLRASRAEALKRALDR